VKLVHKPPRMPCWPGFWSAQLARRSSWLLRFVASRPPNLSARALDRLRPAAPECIAGPDVSGVVLEFDFESAVEEAVEVVDLNSSLLPDEVAEDELPLRGL